jgi:predicted nucleic acid-binding protein
MAGSGAGPLLHKRSSDSATRVLGANEGRTRLALQEWLTRLVDALQCRVHGFNVSVANVGADQERLLDKTGQRMPVEDSYIAATARRHGLTIATGK